MKKEWRKIGKKVEEGRKEDGDKGWEWKEERRTGTKVKSRRKEGTGKKVERKRKELGKEGRKIGTEVVRREEERNKG